METGKDLHVSSLLDVYGAFLSKKQYELVEYYYNDDLSLSEIAENVGITRQGVRDSIRRAVAQLYSLEEKVGCLARFSELKTLANAVKEQNEAALPQLLAAIDDL